MACVMDVVSSIRDVDAVRRKLFPERQSWDDKWNSDAPDTKDLTWDNSNDGWSNWNAVDDDADDPEDDGVCGSTKGRSISPGTTTTNPSCWLQECVVSISPVGDVLVLARNRTVVWLQQKWDNDSSRPNFSVVRSETLTADPTVVAPDGVEQADVVTAAMCLPLASQKRSAHGRQDWTAVILGFSLGVVRVHTEEGTLLLVQRFDQSPVVNFKCRSFEPPRYNAMAEQHEELVVVHKKAIVVVHGLGLYQTLRACRNQAAKAAAAGGDAFEAPPLEYKKWALHDHDDVNDCESIGTVSTTAFDRMAAETVVRGSISSSVMMAPPPTPGKVSAASLFVATGTAPYVGFYYAVEGSVPLLVSEAMLAAAQKLSTYFTGFFVGTKPHADKKSPPKLEPATSLPSRFELRDLRRSGISICASPNRRLSAIADDFGRVVIVDNCEGIAVRIFKGYREAQCGWIEVNEEHPDAKPHEDLSPVKCRVAMFLVIYSRRRGILEVWTAQQGPRVAAFNIGRTASLVYCNHTILGATSVKTVLRSWSQSNRCFLLEADGSLRTIIVPFHCALRCDRGRARDLHLLEKVRLEVDGLGHPATKDAAVTNLPDLVIDINMISVRKQALDLLLKSEFADSVVIGEVVSRLLDDLRATRAGQKDDRMDSDRRLLIGLLRRHQQLLCLYDGVLRLRDASPPMMTVDDEKPLQVLASMFHLSELEVDRQLTDVDRYFSVLDRRKRIRFRDTHGPLGPTAFITSFQSPSKGGVEEEDEAVEDAYLPIRLDTREESMAGLARFLFTPLLTSGADELLTGSKDFLDALLKSGIDSHDLLSMLIECWLNSDDHLRSYWRALRNLYSTVIFLSSHSADSASVNASYNEVSSWWSSVRSRLRRTKSVAAALTAAIVCRGAAVTLAAAAQLEAFGELSISADATDQATNRETRGETATNEMSSLSDWEGVHLDTEQWCLLVKQLEDLVSLATLVDKPIPDALASGIVSASSSTANSSFPVTVDGFLERGRGGISELISKWLTRLSLSVLMVVLSDEGDDGDLETHPSDVGNRLQMDELKGSFETVRRHFPHSLRRDVLLANCSWEFAALWNVDKDECKWLDGCVSCLAGCSPDTPHRRGLASILWHTFFDRPFATAAQLIEKVGKAPKERLCRKNVGMSDTALEKFLDCCQRVLDILIKIDRVMPSADDASPVPITLPAVSFRCEMPWQDTVGPAPLVDVLLEAREPNDELVERHRDLAIVLCAIVSFPLRSCRPLSLYDTRNRALFFVYLSSSAHRLPKETPDLSIVNARIQFLCRLISNVVRMMSECDHADAVRWFGRAIGLGSSWHLDTDQLRRHLVCELYSSGFDSMAEEVLPSVVNCDELTTQLVVIAGRRICHALRASSGNFVQRVTLFSPAVIAWLKSLERDAELNLTTTTGAGGERSIGAAAAATLPLLTYIVNVIPVHQSEHKLALNLMEGLTWMAQHDDSGSEDS